MGQGGESLKWGVERRLEFIEFRLFWDGGVNRADIVNMFDVSVPQASKDLTLYQERAPHNAIYDKSAKRYVAGAQFQPSFLRPDPAAYLNQLRSVAEGILAPSHAWIGQLPSYDATPAPVRGVKTETLRSIIAAIRLTEAIEPHVLDRRFIPGHRLRSPVLLSVEARKKRRHLLQAGPANR